LLTVPVTVVSAGRSFSKLKLTKAYLRLTMTQDRLVGLAILSAQNDVYSSVDYSSAITKSASVKACSKVCL